MADKYHTDLEKIKELVDLMKVNDLVELEIVDGENKIHLKRPGSGSGVVTQMPAVAAAAEPAAEEQKDDGLVEIKSPIVGTFYTAPSPDSEPFVAVNSRVAVDDVVCIVEAMKVMNEIKAEVSGTIVQILCEQGEAVEYGQAIFKVRAD